MKKILLLILMIFILSACNEYRKLCKEILKQCEEKHIDDFIAGNAYHENAKTINSYFTAQDTSYQYYVFTKDIDSRLSSCIDGWIEKQLVKNLKDNNIDFTISNLEYFDKPDPGLKEGDKFSLQGEIFLGKFVFINVYQYFKYDHTGNLVRNPLALKIDFIYIGKNNIVQKIKPFTITDLSYPVIDLEAKTDNINDGKIPIKFSTNLNNFLHNFSLDDFNIFNEFCTKIEPFSTIDVNMFKYEVVLNYKNNLKVRFDQIQKLYLTTANIDFILKSINNTACFFSSEEFSVYSEEKLTNEQYLKKVFKHPIEEDIQEVLNEIVNYIKDKEEIDNNGNFKS